MTMRDVDIELDNGKYHIIADEGMKDFRALRYGKEWRDLCGDGMILALCHEIADLKDQVDSLEDEIIERSNVCGST